MANPVGRPKQKVEVEETEVETKTEIAQEPETKIQFFSEVDMNDQGHITSAMPAWYFDAHIDELREAVGRKERALQMGMVPQEDIFRTREEIKREKVKLKSIEASKPELKGANKDRCWKVYQSLQDQIKDTMPTRKEAKDGLVSPQQELTRLKTKHIKVDPEIAKACGVNVVKGHITGDEANKCYQILGRALGENTFTEALRRDGNTEAYRSMNDLTQTILKGMKGE